MIDFQIVRRHPQFLKYVDWLQPFLLIPEIVTPVEGKTNSSLWRRNKEKGIVTGFHRGKALEGYRELLIRKDNKAVNSSKSVFNRLSDGHRE